MTLRTNIVTIGAAAALLFSGAAGAQGKSLYRWVDENGKVHYSDTVPPEQSRRDRDVLNKRGMTVDRLEGAKTPEEIAAEERRRKREEREKRLAAEQAEKDRILLATFESEQDILSAREDKIDAVENIIQISKGRTKKLNRRLASLIDAAAERERAGKPVPQSLQDDIKEVRAQIEETAQFIERKRTEQERIRAEYEKYIERYRELMAEAGRPSR
ncbi:MAG: DUF4124 domain-containing protein [Gammaproteobacteria bacterium]|nr:DUF4124 domain-containing protein [Gammaproteobacteria bacterium]NIR97663.1 DUF4124 domain-containing protein [Gammaproteobacteria bacterium]NIT63324.1 DUF4124 domain-containing protein [Gammaproteobacteria bacterium]NIV20242.1 DUF4124 domain-containing protein [Gammaproteobacteria bacterium]NIX10659.1 DUF4124 domain-containing protein [Gammaproteobacteria bacterium]